MLSFKTIEKSQALQGKIAKEKAIKTNKSQNMLSKKKSQKRNSFIQSLAQQNDKEISHDTAASIG